MKTLGIDIGGTGIKGAIVNTKTGELVSERFRIATPKPATPEAITKVVQQMVDHFEWKKAVGCTFPSIVVDGKCIQHGNLSKKWLNVKADKLFKKKCNLPFYVSNDADLAGLAEVSFGAAKGEKEVVIVITVGTGIGSGMFYNGKLIPNLEIGRMLHTNGEIIEFYVADSVRKKEKLSLEDWAKRLDTLLEYIKIIYSPSLVVLGGGISKKFDLFKEYLTSDVKVKAAEFKNNAGIIGAAMYASRKSK